MTAGPSGPTFYYVVTANAACGTSANSNQASATATSGKTGTFPPGPGPCKPAAAAATSSTPEQVIAVYGSAAMPLPSSITGVTGVTGATVGATVAGGTGGTDAAKRANRRVPLQARTAANQSARVQFELKKVGFQTVVTPTFASRIDGIVVPNPALIDRILVVAKTDGLPTFVAAVPNPRIRRIHRNPELVRARRFPHWRRRNGRGRSARGIRRPRRAREYGVRILRHVEPSPFHDPGHGRLDHDAPQWRDLTRDL